MLGARGEQLVLGERLEQRPQRALVVRVVDDVLELEDVAQLAAQHRDGAGGLGVRLLREQPDEAVLAGDRAVLADPFDADVDHPRLPVHRARAVGAGDRQQVAADDAGPQLFWEVPERDRLRIARGRLVGEDAEAAAGPHSEARLVDVDDLVLAVAEEDEVVGQQPLEQLSGLLDLPDAPRQYVVAWVLDDRDDTDGNPLADSNDRISLRVESVGALGVRKTIETLVSRAPLDVAAGSRLPGLELLLWRSVR